VATAIALLRQDFLSSGTCGDPTTNRRLIVHEHNRRHAGSPFFLWTGDCGQDKVIDLKSRMLEFNDESSWMPARVLT
jgi:hypothetical protein